MSHYSDAEDTISNNELLTKDQQDGLRKRKIWDPENESITSEIKELLDDDDVNSLVRTKFVFNYSLLLNCVFWLFLGGRGGSRGMPFAIHTGR